VLATLTRTVLLFGSLVAVASAAPIPKELRLKSDAERLLGVWDMPVSEINGKERNKAHWTFENGKMFSVLYGNESGGRGSEWVIKIDPEKTPKEIDITSYKGIYTFDGDRLKIAYTIGADRPTDFKPAEGKYYCELTYVGEAPKR
jgi:uncharacterized protein (TIGR03067 family)